MLWGKINEAKESSIKNVSSTLSISSFLGSCCLLASSMTAQMLKVILIPSLKLLSKCTMLYLTEDISFLDSKLMIFTSLSYLEILVIFLHNRIWRDPQTNFFSR